MFERTGVRTWSAFGTVAVPEVWENVCIPWFYYTPSRGRHPVAHSLSVVGDKQQNHGTPCSRILPMVPLVLGALLLNRQINRDIAGVLAHQAVPNLNRCTDVPRQLLAERSRPGALARGFGQSCGAVHGIDIAQK